jgi:hypothetical protein
MEGLTTGDEHKQGLIGADGKELSTPKPLKTALYLDASKTPVRNITGYAPWAVVRNFPDFAGHIMRHGIPDYISFEHDLAEEHFADFAANQAQGVMAIEYDSFTEKTGYHCAQWLISFCEMHRQNGADMSLSPHRIKTVGIHSDNPAGAVNIMHLLQDYMTYMGWELNVFQAKPEAK